MKHLKKLALVLCLLAVFNLGLSLIFPTHQAAAAPATTPPAPVKCDPTTDDCNPVCGTLDQCLTTSTTPDAGACAAGSRGPMDWVLCPVVTAASQFTDQLNNLVEGQLHFNVNSYLADSTTTTCGPDACQVNKAWVIVKNIVSGLVVVLMLVMVISQAAGGQMFDAYTVKKMLPRLAIAVILMQFSWVLAKWTISSVNDIAIGVKQLMLAPFGGPQNMDLSSIMHHVNPAFPIATSYAVLGVLLLFLILFSDFILPLFIFLAVAIAGSVLVALATLVFRNTFIIMAVIFAPLALLLWAVPGQTFQGLWKKYADNVMKMLFLFPLIMAMIYGARIIAWLAGGLPGAKNIMTYLVVLIAFFVPYFILPKTFKWGGQILGTINNEINSNKAVGMMKGWGYGLAKDSAAEARGKRAADYSDSPAAASRFKENSFMARGLRGVGLGRVLADKYKVPRKKPFVFNKQRANMFGSGMIFQSDINRKKAARMGKEWKGQTDDAQEELMKRAAEKGRKGEMKGFMVLSDKNGKPKLRPMMGSPGWDQYFAQLTRDYFSPDKRRAENASKLMFTHPEFGIFSNNYVPLDPKNRMSRRRAMLEKKYGVESGKIGQFDENNPHKKDVALLDEEDRLRRIDEGSRTADDNKRLEELTELIGLRVGGHTPFDSGTRKNMQETIDFIRKSGGELIQDPNDPDLFYARAGQLKSTQLKGTSVPEVSQGIGNMNYEDLPTVRSRLMRNNWVPMSRVLSKNKAIAKRMQAAGLDMDDTAGIFADPIIRAELAKEGYDPDNIVDQRLYGPSDEKNYAEGDQASPGRYANFNESSWGKKAASIKKAWRKGKFRFALQKTGNIDEPNVLEGLTDLRYFTSAVLDRQDPSVSQVLTNILGVKSTAKQFREALAAVGGPAEIASMARDYKGTQWEPQAKENSREWFETRDAFGIDPYDTGPITDRDIRILEAVPYYSQYYKNADARFVRHLFDTKRDPNGRRDPSKRVNDSNYRDNGFSSPEEWNHYKQLAEASQSPGDVHPDIAEYVPPLSRRGRQKMSDTDLGSMIDDMIVNGQLPSDAVEAAPVVADGDFNGWRIKMTPQIIQRVSQRAQDAGVPKSEVQKLYNKSSGVSTEPTWHPTRLATMTRAPIPDSPVARAAAAEHVYATLSGTPGVTLPPAVITAIETAHTSFNAPRYAKDPSRPPGYDNYNDEALLGKRRIIMQAVEAAIPDRKFARKFAGEIIARGIAGPPPPAQAQASTAPAAEAPTEIRIDHSTATQMAAAAAAPGPSTYVAAPAAPPPPPPTPPPRDFTPQPIKVPSTALPSPGKEIIREVPSGKGVSVRGGQTQGEMPLRQGRAAAPEVGEGLANMRAHIAEDKMRHALDDAVKRAVENAAASRPAEGNKQTPEHNRSAVDESARHMVDSQFH